MKYCVDTSSLLVLVRYYSVFDNETISERIKQLFDTKHIILLNAVKTEIRGVAKGLIVDTLPFLDDVKTESNIEVITAKEHRKIDDHWAIQNRKNSLEPTEYEESKNKEIQKADFQLIFYALRNNEMAIVTEETKDQNDNKHFKKIPFICKHENITYMNLPEMLKNLGLKIDYLWETN